MIAGESLESLERSALERIATASSIEDLEVVRIEVLGRKGTLAQISKEFGKLSPEERASLGKALNAAKSAVETALDARKSAFERSALDERLRSEWVDLTLPAPGPRPASLHPVTQVQREIEDLRR